MYREPGLQRVFCGLFRGLLSTIVYTRMFPGRQAGRQAGMDKTGNDEDRNETFRYGAAYVIIAAGIELGLQVQ